MLQTVNDKNAVVSIKHRKYKQWNRCRNSIVIFRVTVTNEKWIFTVFYIFFRRPLIRLSSHFELFFIIDSEVYGHSHDEWMNEVRHTVESKGVFIATQLNSTQLTQLNSVKPSQSCFCLWRHDLQTESTGSLRSLIGDSCSRCERVDNSTSSWVELCPYKHPLIPVYVLCLYVNCVSYAI